MTKRARRLLSLTEYQTGRLSDIEPTAVDETLANSLSKSGLTVRWLRDGEVEVAASSWVGSARFSSFDVSVVPKLVGGSLNVLRMVEYASGVDILRRLPHHRPLPADGRELQDLICLLLTEEARALVRRGVIRDYRVVDDSITVLRGRLRHGDQLTSRYGQLQTLECRFDEYDADVPENQLVTAALLQARRMARNAAVRRATAELASQLLGVCTPPPDAAAWLHHPFTYDRRNQHYRPAHELAALILGRHGLSDLFSMRGTDVNVFLLDMNPLFEAFVTRLVKEALAGTNLRVTSQKRLRATIRDDAQQRGYTGIAPDLVVEDRGTSVPFDVKYKTYDQRSVTASDIYQTFLYGYTLAAPNAEPRAGILYPATSTRREPRLSIRRTSTPSVIDARILGTGLDIPTTLSSINRPDWPDVLAEVREAVISTVQT